MEIAQRTCGGGGDGDIPLCIGMGWDGMGRRGGEVEFRTEDCRELRRAEEGIGRNGKRQKGKGGGQPFAGTEMGWRRGVRSIHGCDSNSSRGKAVSLEALAGLRCLKSFVLL